MAAGSRRIPAPVVVAARGGSGRARAAVRRGTLLCALCLALLNTSGCSLFDRGGPNSGTPREQILGIAADFAASGDLAAAQEQLGAVNAPNPQQLLLLTAEEFVQSGEDNTVAVALVQLVEDLGLTSAALTEFAVANGILGDAPAASAGVEVPLVEDLPASGDAATGNAAAPASDPGATAAEEVATDETATDETTTDETAADETVADETADTAGEDAGGDPADDAAALATPTPEPTPAPEVGPQARVTSPLNVRNGPGTAYTVVGGLQAGETVDILGKNSAADWWQIELEGGVIGWVFAPLVEAGGDLNAVAVITDIPAPPEPTAAPVAVEAAPEPEPAAEEVAAEEAAPPASEGPHFTMVNKRLWDVYENGGRLEGPSVTCGEKRQLQVLVLDAAGQPVNGVVVQAQLGARESETTGSKGPGIAEFVLGGGQEVKIIRDADGRDATSDVAYGLTTKPWEIPFEFLIAGQFCTDNDSCQKFVDAPGCYGHYSWTVTYQRNY